ncbi:hypothetical protein BH09PAT1_BH09PAT1_2120 [soil metagenome]
MQKLLIGFLIIALVVEGTITSLPLVLLMLLICTTQLKTTDVFLSAFLAGVILDVLLVRPLGQTSFYFLMALFLIFMYERKYEITSPIFITIATFFLSLIYFIIFPVPQSFSQIICVTILAFLGFNLVQRVNKRKIKTVHL